MKHLPARYSKKAQLKIQEMAFVLVALFIFFVLVALLYLSVRFSTFKEGVVLQREAEAKALAGALTGTPEFAWTATSCAQCIDTDKVLVLKELPPYRALWDLDFLAIEWVYPSKTQRECTTLTYPDCSTLTLVNRSRSTPVSAYVALCRHAVAQRPYVQCDIGKVYAAGRSIGNA